MSAALKSMLIELGHQFVEESNKALDLSTWLPSYEAAKEYHGDYAFEFIRTPADIMVEASIVFSVLQGYIHTRHEIEEWFSCPCGEPEHFETAEGIAKRFQAKWHRPIKIQGVDQ